MKCILRTKASYCQPMEGRNHRHAQAHRIFFNSLNCGRQNIRFAVCHHLTILSSNASGLPLTLMSLSPIGIRICDLCFRVFILGFTPSALPPAQPHCPCYCAYGKCLHKSTRRIQVTVPQLIFVGKYN